jgi:hypothetical protein
MNSCICPSECDCANPDGIGVAHVSELCPEHNVYPRADQECEFEGTHNNGAIRKP